jgi:hypothetical protein
MNMRNWNALLLFALLALIPLVSASAQNTPEISFLEIDLGPNMISDYVGHL